MVSFLSKAGKKKSVEVTHLRASVKVIVNIEYKYLTFWKLLAMNKSECCINNEFLKDRPSVIFFSSLYSADILKEASNRK